MGAQIGFMLFCLSCLLATVASFLHLRQMVSIESFAPECAWAVRDSCATFVCVLSERVTLRLYMPPRGNLVDGLPRAPGTGSDGVSDRSRKIL